MTNPVSAEQAEGPKKVKAVRSGLIIALVTFPQIRVESVLKLHLESSSESLPIQDEQTGSVNPEGGPGSSITEESLIVSPSKL